MTERGILFSAPMVRALLAGTKTQTRRTVKITHRTPGLAACLAPPVGPPRPDTAAELCPYGRPGDRLWVRETWAPRVDNEMSAERWTAGSQGGPKPDLHFAATPSNDQWVSRWRPSIHMPRWACRIVLEIVSVRVERLNDCSEGDAIAEGIGRVGPGWERWHPDPDDTEHTGSTQKPCLSYMGLWESINGAGSWATNPWVWVVEFKVLK